MLAVLMHYYMISLGFMVQSTVIRRNHEDLLNTLCVNPAQLLSDDTGCLTNVQLPRVDLHTACRDSGIR